MIESFQNENLFYVLIKITECFRPDAAEGNRFLCAISIPAVY